jgi:hypothetical protein
MKFLAFLALVAGAANAHTIFQKISVNGSDKGQGVGVRVARSNNVSFRVRCHVTRLNSLAIFSPF